ncbi:hypothetical protein OCU04_007591 [Sclerotinia nivalis]|uniref:Uncharacterized protein n=1 Tax=Sclerotinia nivalis TaxID=352851 RepID=A0A9X0AK33_9HELO|nr:hypothetical protein OCU04_007591 [Sclerotinia nivalis]
MILQAAHQITSQYIHQEYTYTSDFAESGWDLSSSYSFQPPFNACMDSCIVYNSTATKYSGAACDIFDPMDFSRNKGCCFLKYGMGTLSTSRLRKLLVHNTPKEIPYRTTEIPQIATSHPNSPSNFAPQTSRHSVYQAAK